MENLADDYYEFIGVTRDASPDDIKKACNILLLKYHPDRCKTVFAEGITQHINLIKETLMDSEKRRVYDLTIPAAKATPKVTPKTNIATNIVSKVSISTLMSDGYARVEFGDLKRSKYARDQCRAVKKSGFKGFKIFSGSSYKYAVKVEDGKYIIYRKKESIFDQRTSY